MTVFVASDLHISHRNILKYCPHRCSPNTDLNNITDADIDRMNETIIARWNSMIMPEDETYIIGDVAMGQIFKAPALIRRLNGMKYLIRGNHDKTLVRDININPDLADLFAWHDSYHEMSYKYGSEKHFITMSHYPMHSWNRQSQGSLHLHGHLHGNPHGIPGRIKDVGIDTNDLYPYRMDDVVREILKKEVRGNHHE